MMVKPVFTDNKCLIVIQTDKASETVNKANALVGTQ